MHRANTALTRSDTHVYTPYRPLDSRVIMIFWDRFCNIEAVEGRMAEPADTYRRLLDVAKSVGHTRLRTSRRHTGQRRTELQQLLDDVTDKLRSERAVSAIEEAWRNLDGDVASLLLRELSLITTMHEGRNSKDERDDVSTGKESIEDILALPDWLKHLLRILNEILALVK